MSADLQPLWRQREYMLLWGGQVMTTLGAQALGIIYPLLILALTGSPAQASAATALRMLPYLLLSLPVGALIDRWDRRQVTAPGRSASSASLMPRWPWPQRSTRRCRRPPLPQDQRGLGDDVAQGCGR